MKLVIISDTHGKHAQIPVPEGDVLIHCGDFTAKETWRELTDFAKWLGTHSHEYKLVICGNHDSDIIAKKHYQEQFFAFGVHYLQDDEIILGGKKFYGMPWTPEFFNWYWMKERNSDDMAQVVRQIPKDVNVLITHGPSFGALDCTVSNQHVGCSLLTECVETLGELDIHCFGHIHEAAGICGNSINASVLNVNYQVSNPAVVADI